ncbi:hypothetical protein psal_cds_922 [Pandoravirus salinus]|uniref:Uncharacterized protein n=1 Tax=Pandoravirus salinus TaxID=1349410 RepID=A0A291ATX6_9VIRU|nr:hypothetical protein psal_cds_922 [Pandoravirus salinus]ATE82256.1 hypothetical protein psal_cds_922 [Pandoravirus salinus]
MSAYMAARPHRQSKRREAPKMSAAAIACCVDNACALDVLHALTGMKSETSMGAEDNGLATWIGAAHRVDDRIAEIVANDGPLLTKALQLEPHQKADAHAVVCARDIWYKRLGDAWYDTRYSAVEIDRTLGALDSLASTAVALLNNDVLGALRDEARAWRRARHDAIMAPAVDHIAKRIEADAESLGGIVHASEAIRDTYAMMCSGDFGNVMAALTRSPQHSAIALVFGYVADGVIDPRLNIIDVMDRAIERVCLPPACSVKAEDDSGTD